MKKISLLLVCVFLCLIALATMSSCGNIKAAMTWSKVANKMNKLDSYEIESSSTLVYYVEGKEVTTVTKGTVIVDGVGTDDYYYYNKADIKITAPELDIDQELVSVEAYSEGYYYIRNQTGGVNNKLCGPMSLDEFNERVNSASVPAIKVGKCDKVTEKTSADGTKTLVCSGYDEERLADFADLLDLDTSLFEQDITDCNITLIYNADDKLIRTVTFAFRFEADEDNDQRPRASVTMKYSKYNEAERTDRYIKKSGYTEIENIKLLNDIDHLLQELSGSSNGHFKMKTDQSLLVGGRESKYSEENDIKFSMSDGKISYDIKCKIEGEEYTLRYSNGKRSGTLLKKEGADSSTKQTENEAQAFIAGLINSSGYNKANISNITVVGDGVYQLDCQPLNRFSYKSLLESSGISYRSASQVIQVTVSSGKITKIWTRLTIKGAVRGSDVSLTIVNENTFD